MKINYYSDTDSLYIHLSYKPSWDNPDPAIGHNIIMPPQNFIE